VALSLALLFSAASLSALEAPEMAGPVNDLAGIMTAESRQSLVEYLSAVNSQTGVQVGVLTVPSLQGDSIEAFSMRTAEKWKLGQKGKDNGALLVVAARDKALRIEVGYGLEPELTDVKCGLIIRSVIAPAFRDGDYSRGITEGVRNIVGIATGNAEIVSEKVRNPERSSDNSSPAASAVFIVFFLLFILLGLRRRRSGFGSFIAGALLSDAFRGGSRNDRWHGGSGGFGGGGGFSGGGGFGGGGGFSGGGGGFGGGGASGGW
jgi:uncharacterized protein